MWRGAALLLLCLLTFLLGLGRTAIVDSDEAFYAGAGREMVVDGDWITPHYNFEERLNKPVLYYWLVAGTYKLVGTTEGAARFWAAMSGVGLALLAAAIGRRWVDQTTGFVAGAIVATSIGVVLVARQALPDISLALFISVTVWSAIEAASTTAVEGAGRGAPGWSRRTWLVTGAVAMGLGMATKGPIAVVLPVVAVVPLLVWEWYGPRRGDRPRFPLGVADLAIATVVFVVVAAPWYVAVTRVHGLDFLHQFFVGENLNRFASEKFNERREIGFYLGVIAGGLLPWTTFTVLWIRPIRELLTRRRALSPVAARLGAWALGPLLLLTASAGSQPRYVLPIVLPVSVLLARSITTRIREADAGRRDLLLTGATAAAGAALVLFGILILRAKPLLVAVNPGWTPIGAIAVVAGGVVALAAALVAPRRFVPAVIAMGAAISVLAFNATVLRAHRPEPVEIISAAIRERAPTEDVCACGAFSRNLTFYTHARVFVAEGEREMVTFMQQPGIRLAVVDADRLAAVESTLGRRFPRHAEVTYLNPALWQKAGAALLDPNPDRYVLRVFLVSNQ